MVKHTQTIRRLLVINCLSVFDHFVGLALKGLITIIGIWKTCRQRKFEYFVVSFAHLKVKIFLEYFTQDF